MKVILLLWIARMGLVQPHQQIGAVQFSSPVPIGNLVGVERQAGNRAGKAEVIDFKLDAERCKIRPSPFKDYIYFDVPDIPPGGKPGEPQLPLKSFVVKLPLGSEVTGVEVVAGTYVKITNRLKIVPNPTPLIRQPFGKQKGGEYIPNPQIYELEHYFPGRLVSFETGSDNRFTYCFVRFFPLQYIPAKGEAVLITSANISIYYRETTYQGSKGFKSEGVSLLPLMGNEKSIIICPQEFRAQAESLKVFHEVMLGSPTYIATTEWIAANYDTAPKPPFSGWSYVDTATAPIRGYNFTLARKIINYLRDKAAHPNLEYIVILGDAQKVPPSYYFVGGEWFGGSFDFAPSDFLYSSPDYDFVPNYGVGRLSVSNTSELAHIVRKIKDWYPADWTWFKNTIIAGGDAFPARFTYFDEALLSDCINHGYFTGGNNLKYFRSDEKFTASTLAPYLRNGNLGIFFEAGHGSGPAIQFDDHSEITADDLLGYPTAQNLPIVATPCCIVGAFDIDLAGFDFHTSFGEAVLKSRAGGICFFGGTRANFAGFDYYIDEGRLVITRHRYFDQIFTNVAKSYHAGRDTLGAIYKNAVFDFVSANDMVGDTLNQWSLFCFILLGDPALPIPSQVPGDNYQTPLLSAPSPTYYNIKGYPVYHLGDEVEVTIASNTNSPTVKYKLCNAMKAEKAIDTTSDNTQPFDYTFSADSGMRFYIIRTETEDKKEGWLYTYTTTGDIVADGDPQDWDRAGITPCAVDPNDFTPDDHELTTLYVYYDKHSWYFGFDVFTSEGFYTRTYTIAIDCIPDGYTGTQGVDKDALGHWVTFGANHPVDYEIGISMWGGGIFPIFAKYSNGAWELLPLEEVGGYAAFDTLSHFLEVMLPADAIGNPAVVYLSLYSGAYNFENYPIIETSPALDAVPTDPATYDTIVWGSAYANTITNFVTVYGIEEVQPKRTPILSLNVLPNPSCGDVVIHFGVPPTNPQSLTLKVYDLCGRLVKSLITGTLKSGEHSIKWNTSDVPSGVYFVRLDAGEHKLTKKLIITK